ncbi:MAG: glutathione S-transferase family protein [Burkholderiales bacterium]
MKLYGFSASPNTSKVMAVAAHLGLPLDYQEVDLTRGEQRKPSFLKLNPNGLTPTLVDGDFVLWESNVVMQYLACKKKGNKLFPAEVKVRADITRWQFWAAAHWERATNTLQWENLLKPMFGIGPPDLAKIAEAEESFHRHAAVLNKKLANRKYIMGDAITLADFSIAASLV